MKIDNLLNMNTKEMLREWLQENHIYLRRLEKLIKKTRDNQMYGDWNDSGRLLDY